MATNLSDQASVSIPRQRTLSGVRLVLALGLLALLVLCLAFFWITRDAMTPPSFVGKQDQQRAGTQKTLVDLRPWETAQALAALAVTAEEVEYAREAERLADHEVDQAFASA